jgi:hypothetical protein
VAKGNIGFALLKQSGIIANFATIGSHPGHFGRTRPVGRAAKQHTERGDHTKSECLTSAHFAHLLNDITVTGPKVGGPPSSPI